jgi:hypothetical protein
MEILELVGKEFDKDISKLKPEENKYRRDWYNLLLFCIILLSLILFSIFIDYGISLSRIIFCIIVFFIICFSI